VKRLGYQALGFGVWQALKWVLLGRYRRAQGKLALAGLLAVAVAALLLLGRRRATSA
jgi:hypothetical protein